MAEGFASRHAGENYEKLFPSVLEAANLAGIGLVVTIVDGDRMDIVLVSAAAGKILGRPPEELLGDKVWEYFDPEELPRLLKLHAKRLQGLEVPKVIETFAIHSDGHKIEIEIATARIQLEDKLANVTFLRDISAGRALEQRVAQAERLAAMATLAAGVAHEINNPLAYLLLSLKTVLQRLPSLSAEASAVSSLQQQLEDALDGAERVARIVRDLSSLAAPQPTPREPIDLREALEAAVRIVAHELGQVTLLERAYSAAPRALANAQRIEQVFVNLLVNAAQAVPQQGGKITISVDSDERGRPVTRISDNGPGIPREQLERVFEPFFTTKARGVGSGLGLPICRAIISALGGEIDVESEVGRGTTVRVALPAAPADA